MRRISKDLCDMLDKMKEIIAEFGWGAIEVSDAEASKVLAKKLKDNNLV